MTPRHRSLVATVAIVILSLVLAACASAATSGDAENSSVERPASEPGGVDGTDAGAPAPAIGEGAFGGGKIGDLGAPFDDARIVRTGTVDLEVKDVDRAVRAARDGLRAMGGYVGASSTYSEGDQPVATITYRVPVDRWEDALDLLRDLGGQTTKVVSEQTQSVEVTGAIVDLEARIKNLEASEKALQDIAASAVKISDVLEVQNQLTQVRGEIESLTAQLKDLEDRADFATLGATYRVPIVAVEAAAQDWDPQAVIDDAAASLIGVAQTVASVGIWFVIVGLPTVLLLGAIALIVVWFARRLGVGQSRRPAADGETTVA
jgi:hypothetical protein